MTASDASAGAAKHPAQAARKVAGEAFTAAWTGQRYGLADLWRSNHVEKVTSGEKVRKAALIIQPTA